MAAARAEARRRVRVLRQARRAVLLLPRSRHRAGGRDVRRDRAPTSTRSSTRPRRTWRGPGSGSCGAPPTCSATRATPPARRPTRTPRCSPTPRPRSRSCSRRRKRLGGANYVLWGGREGYETLLNTDLRREEAQLARFLTLVAEHKHKIGFEGLLLIEPKPQEPTKHQYDYDAATVHGFLARHGLEDEYRVNIEANHATLAGHSFHHEVAYAVAQRDLRQHRRQPRRLPERLGHRPVPELGRRAVAGRLRDPARRRLHDRRLQLRHEAAPPEHRPDRPVPRPHRRHRHARPGAARRGAMIEERRALARLREERYAGWDGELGPSILDGKRVARDLEAWVDRAARSTPAGVGPAGAPREPRQPADLGRRPRRIDGPSRWPMGSSSASTSRRPPRRPSSSTSRGPSVAIGVAEYGVRRPAAAVERAGPAAVVGGGVVAIRAALATAGVIRRRHRRGGAHRADARPRPARCRGRGPATGDPLERPADGRGMRR